MSPTEELSAAAAEIRAEAFVEAAMRLRALWEREGPEGFTRAIERAQGADAFWSRGTPEQWSTVGDTDSVADALFSLGALSLRSFDFGDPSLRLFELAREHGAENTSGAIGAALGAQGRNDEAVPYLRASIDQHDSGWASSMGRLGEILLDRGERTGEVRRLLEMAAAEVSFYAIGLARLEHYVGNEQKAFSAIERAVRDAVTEAYIVWGNLLFDTGRLREAKEAYRLGVRTGDAHSAFNLHLLLRELGRFAEARRALQLARQMGDHTHPDAEHDLRYEARGGTTPARRRQRRPRPKEPVRR